MFASKRRKESLPETAKTPNYNRFAMNCIALVVVDVAKAREVFDENYFQSIQLHKSRKLELAIVYYVQDVCSSTS